MTGYPQDTVFIQSLDQNHFLRPGGRVPQIANFLSIGTQSSDPNLNFAKYQKIIRFCSSKSLKIRWAAGPDINILLSSKMRTTLPSFSGFWKFRML